MTERYGIIGHPLGHTLSPVLHNGGFAELGIDATYEAWPTPPEELGAFMERFRADGLRGLSVTIPHKRAVMAHVDRLTGRAKAVGAVNTLYWDGTTLVGENTDVAGIVEPLAARGVRPGRALVLGAGGAARAVVAALVELGAARVLIANRTADKARSLADDFGAEALDWDRRGQAGAGLIVNTTPLGMKGGLQDRSPMPADALGPGVWVFDIVYNPLETRLLADARALGASTIEGLEMFVHQGLAQFRLWTGQDMDEAAARARLLAALSK